MFVTDLDNFSPRRGFECFNACLVNCLAMQGYNLNSSDIFFSENNKIFRFCKEEDMLYVNDFTASFVRNHAIQLTELEEKEPNVKDYFLNDKKTNIEHLIIGIRPEKLNYSSVFAENSMGYGHMVNVVNADSEGIEYVDGYVYTVFDELHKKHTIYDVLEEAWKMDNYMSCHLTIPRDLDIATIKSKAIGNYLSYLNSTHENIMTSSAEDAKDDVLYLFLNLRNKLMDEQCIDMEFINRFLSQVKVVGFLILKNTIWEKINEKSSELAEEYYQYIKKWNHILLVMRKKAIRNNKEDLISLYEEIYKLVIDEDKWIMNCYKKEL